MANCSPTAIMAEAKCLACDFNHKELLAALVYVLCQANSMSCTPATLAAESECLRCSMTEKQLLAAAVYLICNGGTGGGGTQQVLQAATGSPPPDPTKPAISFPTGGGGISEWDVASQTWI